MAFEKAQKKKSKLRLAVFGPSGSGKTYSALSIASGMGAKVAVVDSEFGSASKYADRFNFDVDDLGSDQSVDRYVTAINGAGEAGYDVLILDSITHAWDSLLDQVGDIAKARYRGNTWSAWSEGTPIQKAFVRAIQSSPCHIIATMRSKTEWAIEKTDKGKNMPVKIGLSPQQKSGMEYEFDMLMELTTDHYATISKDRTGKYQDKIIEKPGKEFGLSLLGWLNEGLSTEDIQKNRFDNFCKYIETIIDVDVAKKLIGSKKMSPEYLGEHGFISARKIIEEKVEFLSDKPLPVYLENQESRDPKKEKSTQVHVGNVFGA